MTINELNNLTLADIESRIAALDTEVNSLGESDATDETIKRINDAATEKQMLLSRKAELEAIEMRKANAEQVANGAGTPVERGGVNPIEERAKQLVETGKMELRQLLSTTATLLKPDAYKQEIGELPEVLSTIIDDVNAFELSGRGAWTYAYRTKDSAAAKVTEGSDIGGTDGTFAVGKIEPETWGIFSEISNQVKQFTPLNYEASIRNNAYLALRRYAKKVVTKAILDSTLVDKKEDVTIDENFLRNLVLGFNADEAVAGGTKLYLTKATLQKLGAIRGTSEKRALYEITFADENNGTIKEGGMAVNFSLLSDLADETVVQSGATDVMIYGQMKAVDMPLWGNYTIETDEGGEFFKRNMMAIRGLQTAGAGVVIPHAVQVINNKANP